MRGMFPLRWLPQALAGVLMAAFLAASLTEPSLSDTPTPERTGLKDSSGAGISGNPRKPRRHFRVRNLKKLTPEEAQTIYDEMRKAMGDGYAISDHPAANGYQKWRRFNTTPYLSASHGQRYLSTYANAKGVARAAA